MCPYKAKTGMPCLGCGGTHAFGAMARGDVRGAIRANPLGAASAGMLWILAAAACLALAAGTRRPLAIGALIVLVAAPAAFVWNAAVWWRSLPPTALSRQSASGPTP
jgi:hypothetical protein